MFVSLRKKRSCGQGRERLGGTGWDWAGFSGWEKVESDTGSAHLPRELSGRTPRGGYPFNWVLLSLPGKRGGGGGGGGGGLK